MSIPNRLCSVNLVLSIPPINPEAPVTSTLFNYSPMISFLVILELYIKLIYDRFVFMIKYFLIITSLSFIIFINCSENNVMLDLKSFEWKNRILVIGGNDSKYQNQFDNLEVNKNEYTDRDMVVILINKDESKISHDGLNVFNNLDYDSTLSIRKRFNFDDFNLILIGKDGGVKYNTNKPVKINKIFEIIDKMPMRMKEIKERN